MKPVHKVDAASLPLDNIPHAFPSKDNKNHSSLAKELHLRSTSHSIPSTTDTRIDTSSVRTMHSLSDYPQGYITGINEIVYTAYSPTYHETSGLSAMMPGQDTVSTRPMIESTHRMADGTTQVVRVSCAMDNFYQGIQGRALQPSSVSFDNSQLTPINLSPIDLEKLYLTALKLQRSGTAVSEINIQIHENFNPKDIVDALLAQGFEPGFKQDMDQTPLSVRFHQYSPLEISFRHQRGVKNPLALVDSVDHMVFSVNELEKNSKGKNPLELWQVLFQQHFWGDNHSRAFSEAIEADGVGMKTQVNHNTQGSPAVVFPEVHSVLPEQMTVKMLLSKKKEDYIPQYLKNVALENQVSRGMHSFNDVTFQVTNPN